MTTPSHRSVILAASPIVLMVLLSAASKTCLGVTVDSREWIGYSAPSWSAGGGYPRNRLVLTMAYCDGSQTKPTPGSTYSRVVTDPNVDYFGIASTATGKPLYGLDGLAKRFPITDKSGGANVPAYCDSTRRSPHVILQADIETTTYSRTLLGYGTGGIGQADGQCTVYADDTTITVVPSPRGSARSVPAVVSVRCPVATEATLAVTGSAAPYVKVGRDDYELRVNGTALPRSYTFAAGVTPLSLTVLPLQNTNRPGTYEGHTIITVTYQ